MLRSPRAPVAAPKPAFRGVRRLWFRLPSALNWLFCIVKFVGLVNCADVFRALMSTVLSALKTSARSSARYLSLRVTRILRTTDMSTFLVAQPRM